MNAEENQAQSDSGIYICLISIHGLIRGENLELGRDADTGGQTKYVVELARALAKEPGVRQVDLLTRLVDDPEVSPDYAQPSEELGERARIVRIAAGPPGYLAKEALWDLLDLYIDNCIDWLRTQSRMPDLLHSHYADAGYVGSRLSHLLGIPLVHTGHSLGRNKLAKLEASGMNIMDINKRYKMDVRVKAEEDIIQKSQHHFIPDFRPKKSASIFTGV